MLTPLLDGFEPERPLVQYECVWPYKKIDIDGCLAGTTSSFCNLDVLWPASMKLADYLVHYRVPAGVMRRQLGLTAPTFRRILTGERMPGPHTIQHIKELTGGEVTLRDYLDRKPPLCAVEIRKANGKKTIMLPFNDSDKNLDACVEAVRNERAECDRYTPPLKDAMRELGMRVWPQGKAMFLLDGKPSDARMIVEAANRIRRGRGEGLIRYPGVG